MSKEEAAFERKLEKIRNDKSLELKPKKPTKKETKMNTKKTVLTTIALTLFVIAVLAGTFYAGTQYESGRNAAIKNEAAKLVEQLKSESQ